MFLNRFSVLYAGCQSVDVSIKFLVSRIGESVRVSNSISIWLRSVGY